MTFDFPAPLFSGSTFDPGFLSSFLFDEPVFFSPTPVSSGSDSIPVSSPDITKNPSPGSKNKRPAGSSETSNCLDERKRRRKISNRESARRSRERKQKHVEDLRIQVNRLKVENRELMNRLRYVVHYTGLFNTENEFLRSESVVLTRTLLNIRQVLLARHLLNPQTSSSSCINNYYMPINSLIT